MGHGKGHGAGEVMHDKMGLSESRWASMDKD
jgi:hypothetical protein